MTKEEYRAAIEAADRAHTKAVNAAKLKYAESLRVAKVGDKVTDGEITIIIDRIIVNISWAESMPYDLYEGFLLKKDGKPGTNKKRAALANLGKLVNLSTGEQE